MVHKKLPSPSQINVSVVAPLMMASNVLCLYYDGETFYILSSKGYISQFYKSSDDLTDYHKLNTLNIDELFHDMEIYEHLKIPDGCIPIRDEGQQITALDFNRFLSTKDLNSVMNMSEDDWKTLIQYGKVANKLHELRSFVNQMKCESIHFEKENLKEKFDFKYVKHRDDIVAKIVQLKLNEIEHSNELNELRQQLHEISDQAKVEEIQYLQYINGNLHITRKFWNHIQSLIHEQEKGSYSINDFTFASNRANRAKVVKANDDDDDSDGMQLLDHTNVPLFECAICMEQGPFVLWLNAPTDLDSTTNDFIINFPLEGNESLKTCFVSNPVCGFCAQSYMNAAVNELQQLQTLYREPCTGFIPLNWTTPTNRTLINNSLYRILTGNRILHHVQMLLLAMLDDNKTNWLESGLKNHLIKQIMENIYTTDSFSEEGTRMIFINALQEIIKQEDKLLRQPFNAVCRILRFNHMFHQLDKEIIETLLRKRFALMCIENQCSKTKFGPQHLSVVKQDLFDILFDTTCGIPTQNSFKKIDINNQKLKGLLNKYYDSVIKSVDKIAENLNSDRTSLIPAETISFILYTLTTILEHDRPMKIYNDFTLKYQQFRRNMYIEWSTLEKQVDQTLFGHFFSSPGSKCLGFAINLGRYSSPSKLFFYTEPLWTEDMQNKRINIATLTNQIKRILDGKMVNYYGNSIPTTRSAHFLLHSTIARVLEDKYPHEELMNDHMIMDCMVQIGQTAGRKGNIYTKDIFPQVVLAIENYLTFRRTMQNMAKPDNEMLSRSFQYKLLVELISNGMEYDENSNEVLFEPSKLKPPQINYLDKSTINFDELRKRVQELYLASKVVTTTANNQKQTCLNFEIQDFIEFGYNMDFDKLLPLWETYVYQDCLYFNNYFLFKTYFREQKDIVSSIITDHDEIEQPLKYIAGLDISFVKTNDKAVASMVIFDYETLNIVAKISVNCNMKIPYKPGYLAFREAPVFMKVIDIQKERCPHLTPQVILMDGNGIWHPRRAGIASHFGVLSGIPCFGVSKNVLYADGITREKVEDLLNEYASNEDQTVEVMGDSGDILGLAYNVTGAIKNAVYISAGHKITLKTACEIFKSVTKYRICEPIRQADLLSRELVLKIS